MRLKKYITIPPLAKKLFPPLAQIGGNCLLPPLAWTPLTDSHVSLIDRPWSARISIVLMQYAVPLLLLLRFKVLSLPSLFGASRP